MSTPFSVQAVDLLSKIGVKAFKIGSEKQIIIILLVCFKKINQL